MVTIRKASKTSIRKLKKIFQLKKMYINTKQKINRQYNKIYKNNNRTIKNKKNNL